MAWRLVLTRHGQVLEKGEGQNEVEELWARENEGVRGVT